MCACVNVYGNDTWHAYCDDHITENIYILITHIHIYYTNKLNVNECESHTFILTYVVVSVNSQPDRFWHHLGDKAPGIPLRNYLASGHACN